MLQRRFDNFKAFVAAEIPNSAINYMLGMMNLETFLALIIKTKEQYDTGRNVNLLESSAPEVTKTILDKLSLNPEAFDPAALDKFERYVAYFLEVIEGKK